MSISQYELLGEPGGPKDPIESLFSGQAEVSEIPNN